MYVCIYMLTTYICCVTQVSAVSDKSTSYSNILKMYPPLIARGRGGFLFHGVARLKPGIRLRPVLTE